MNSESTSLPSPATTPRWSTSSFGEHAQASPMELSALREHLALCSGAHRRWFRARCAAEAVQGFVAARLVTTVLVAALPLAFLLFRG